MRDRQTDCPVRTRMGARCRPVPLVRGGGTPHLRAHHRIARAWRSFRGAARADRDRRRLHRLELSRRAGRPQGGAGAGGGCSTIVRPSSQTPGTAMLMVDCIRAGNLPAGAVSLVVGPTTTTYAPIMASPAVRKVSLTGSTRVGQQMIRDAADTSEEGVDGTWRQRAADRLRRRRPGRRAQRFGADQISPMPARSASRRTASSCTRACTTPLSRALFNARRR